MKRLTAVQYSALKYKIVCISLILFVFATNTSVGLAQNLVPNGSFENMVNCPTGAGEIQQVIEWNTFRESPDYFNSCASIASYYSVPSNAYGYQQAASGNAYVGIICYNNSIFSREIIANSLTTPLSVGQKYFVSFKINKSNDNSIAGYNINGMGVNLSTVTHTNLNIDNSPLFYTNSIISDTINWITISGSFIADSAYQYLMIGNFFDDANTTVVNNGIGPYAYYLIDDVCLSTDSLLCANFSATVEENNIKNQFTFYPNPANSFVTIGNNSHITFDIEIYNALGQRLYEEKNTTTNAKTIDTSPFNNGILFINITSKNQSINYKLLKQ